MAAALRSIALVAGACALLAGAALASVNAVAADSPQSGSHRITASVPRSCRIVGASGLSFGSYDPADLHAGAPLDASGTLQVRCTRGVAVRVALQQGQRPAGGSNCTTPRRQMASGTQRLRYDLYRDAARTQVWGCRSATPANVATFTSASSALAQTLTVYGRIPPAQNVGLGSYADVVRVTVTF